MVGIAIVLVIVGTVMSWSKNSRVKRYGNKVYTVGVIGVSIAIAVLIVMIAIEG